SGIVWDSEARVEYDECLAKGSVLGQRARSFSLLETLRWTPEDGYFLLDRHLTRLCDSGDYFDVPVAVDAVRSALDDAVAAESTPRRVRLLGDADGQIQVEHRPHITTSHVLSIALASSAIDAGNRFFFHKTTHRAMYERARAAAADLDDVILWNA